MEYWDQLEAKTGPDTKLALDRVNQKIGYKKIVPRPFYQKRMSIAAALIPLLIIAGSYLYYISNTRKSSRKHSALCTLTVKPIFLFGKMQRNRLL